MKKRTILGIGASTLVGLVGGVAAVFFAPKKGPERREAVKKKSEAVFRRERANVATLFGGTEKVSANEKLRESILYALKEVFGKQVGSIDVTVSRGVVTIKGEVAHLVDIEEAESVIRSIDAVREVNNLLRLQDVQKPAPRKKKTAAAE